MQALQRMFIGDQDLSEKALAKLWPESARRNIRESLCKPCAVRSAEIKMIKSIIGLENNNASVWPSVQGEGPKKEAPCRHYAVRLSEIYGLEGASLVGGIRWLASHFYIVGNDEAVQV